jgi:di/tricarboxylate transporter
MFDSVTIVLILLVVALVLFATEKLPVDLIGILLVMALILTGVLTVQEGFAGFGDSIIITIGGLFVLTGGLAKTGLVDLIGRYLYRFAGRNELLLTAAIMFTAAATASVMKNTATTAMYLPVVLGLAERAKHQNC